MHELGLCHFLVNDLSASITLGNILIERVMTRFTEQINGKTRGALNTVCKTNILVLM